MKAMPPAGVPSHYKHKGAGTFAYNTTGGVSLTPPPPAGAPSHPAPKCTEARTSYLPPPAERERSYPILPARNQFPVPNQGTDFKYVRQGDTIKGVRMT